MPLSLPPRRILKSKTIQTTRGLHAHFIIKALYEETAGTVKTYYKMPRAIKCNGTADNCVRYYNNKTSKAVNDSRMCFHSTATVIVSFKHETTQKTL